MCLQKYEATSNGVRLFPAIWFKYQLTPITVKYTLKPKPLYHFITTVCAIVGGTFTVAGIIDSCIFTAHEVFKKIEMGKLGWIVCSWYHSVSYSICKFETVNDVPFSNIDRIINIYYIS